MDEDRVRVDGFLEKTDAPSVKTRDGAMRPTQNGQGRKAKTKAPFKKTDPDERPLRVVYTCPVHSDAALAELVAFLARGLVDREERMRSLEELNEFSSHKSP